MNSITSQTNFKVGNLQERFARGGVSKPTGNNRPLSPAGLNAAISARAITISNTNKFVRSERIAGPATA